MFLFSANCIHRGNERDEARVRLVKQTDSMSVLVPGQGPLKHRVCLEEQDAYLRSWFGLVEAKAWMWANTYGASRPNKIFLVTGQTLTNEWAIAHVQDGSLECELHVEPGEGVPQSLDVKSQCVLGYPFRRVSPSRGFIERRFPDPAAMYSVYFEVVWSFPMRFVSSESELCLLIKKAFR